MCVYVYIFIYSKTETLFILCFYIFNDLNDDSKSETIVFV